jgi:asparagine synthase (glutamine-hydrolysing)
MCDFCGFVAPAPVAASTILAMTGTAKHRGPDDEGYLIVQEPGAAPQLFGGPDTPAEAFRSAAPFAPTASIDGHQGTAVLALGHRRLSIIDLSVLGHQPMSTPDRRYWLVYNGEIYNYIELHDELAALGYTFTSRCDSEVILAGYARWGADCLHRFNGMFAFAIYDTVAGEVFLARDRFGIKPLYYWQSPAGLLAFASELKQFTVAPGWQPRVNLDRAAQFLATGLTDDSDETMFDGVFHLAPGHCATIRLDRLPLASNCRIATRRWYHLAPTPFDGTAEEAVAEYRRLFSDSVRLMMRADIPIGSCLSGGLDSSSIVCLVNQELRRQGAEGLQKTFSARATGSPFDEWPWIEEVVKRTGVDAHSTVPTVEIIEREWSTFAWHQDEPTASTSFFAEWCVYALVKASGLKVMLDGQGADEVLAGYLAFFAPYFASLARAGHFSTVWREMKAFKRRHGYGELAALKGILRSLLSRDRQFESVSALSRAQVLSTNLPMMLRCGDRSSMAHSVESRVPFLDHRLVEFSMGLPDALKIGGGVTKRVLRDAMSGIVPDRTRDRVDKIGFETPEAVWMTGGQRGWFRAELQKAIEISDRFVPASAVIHFDAIAAGTRPFDRAPWRAISFGHWMRAFSVAAPTRARWRPA